MPGIMTTPILRAAALALCNARLCLALAASWPVTVAADPVFAPDATSSCVQALETRSPSRSGHAVLDCVGRAAQACMLTQGGDTTVGMIDCLRAETTYWDARLTAAFDLRLSQSRQIDDELARLGAAAPSLGNALEQMQQAWIDYRHAACLYEQAQWQGGTGGGPATMACHMHETARQALMLEGWWQQ